MTKKQEAITTKMTTIRYTILTIATGEPLFSVDYPRVPVDCLSGAFYCADHGAVSDGLVHSV